MDEEYELENELTETKSERRFHNLSKKVEETARERDSEAAARAEAERQMLEAQKERDFYASYADVATQYPNAKDHKEDIKAKVLAGYTMEDATIAVLAKAGQLTTAPQQPAYNNSFGGSAPTIQPTTNAQPSLADMREQLLKLEASGEFGLR